MRTMVKRGALAVLVAFVGSMAVVTGQTVTSTFRRVIVSERLGVGPSSPARQVSVYDATFPIIQLVNSTSGTGTNDGLEIYQSGANSFVSNQEVGYLQFQTANAARVTISSTGNTGFGTISPAYLVDVNGTLRTTGTATLTTASIGTLGVTGNGTVDGTFNVAGALQGGTVWGVNAVIASDGSATIPGYEFLGNTSTGFYRDASTGRIGWTLAGVHGGFLGAGQFEAERIVGAAGGAFGTGNINGGIVQVGRNSSGAGAAGCVILMDRGGSFLYLYVGGGLLRYNISSEGCPTENNSNPHSGSVIGDQTSTRASKHLLGEPKDRELLDAVLRTRVHRFTYKDGRYNGETFTGIVTDESPWLAKDGGKALNEINAVGYLVGAVRALEARVRELEAQQLRQR
jgi:hypothetical protein